MANSQYEELSGSGAVAVNRSRLCRSRRYAVVLQLLQQIEFVEYNVAASVMDMLDNDCLDSLPDWCLMDDASLQAFQRLAGALYFAPALVQCIHGPRLVEWKNLLGQTLLECVVNVTLGSGFDTLPPIRQSLPEADDSILLATGASILASTLTDHIAQPLIRNRLGDDAGLIDKELALGIQGPALTIFRRTAETISDVCARDSASVSPCIEETGL